ncbi:MAG: AMP-binding protein, partial [Mycobacteriaceae bacterium]
MSSAAYRQFLETRDFLQAHREDYDAVLEGFAWPRLEEFNWALEHIDVVGADPVRGARLALWIVEEDGSEQKFTYADMSERSNRVANWLRAQGVARGDRIVLMLANQVELWETILGAMKLGAVIIPTTPMLGTADLHDRVERGEAKHVVVRSEDAPKFAEILGSYTRIAVGADVEGWVPFGESAGASADFTPEGVTNGA